MPFIGIESAFICGTKFKSNPEKDENLEDVPYTMEGNKSKEKSVRSKRSSLHENNMKRLASPMPAKQTRTSKLREEMNARKSLKNQYKSEPDIRSIVDEETIHPDNVQDGLQSEHESREKDMHQMDEIIKSGFFVNAQNVKYIVFPEEKIQEKEEELEKIQNELTRTKNGCVEKERIIADLEKQLGNSYLQISRLNSSIQMAERESEESRKENENLEKKFKETHTELMKQRKEIETFCSMYQEKLKQYEKEQKNIENENQAMLHDLKKKVNSHGQNSFENLALNDLVGLIANLEIANSELGEKIILLTNENEKIREENKNTQSENESLNKTINDSKTGFIDLQNQMAKLKEDYKNFVESANNEKINLKNICDKKEDDIRMFKEKLKQSESNMMENRSKVNECIEKIDNKNIFIDQLQSQINSLEKEVSKTQGNLALMEKENKSLADAHSKEKEILKQQLKEKLNSMEEKHKGECSKLKSEAEILRKENSLLVNNLKTMDKTTTIKENESKTLKEKVAKLSKDVENKSQEIEQSNSANKKAISNHKLETEQLIQNNYQTEIKLRNEIKQARQEAQENFNLLQVMQTKQSKLEKENSKLLNDLNHLKAELNLKVKGVEHSNNEKATNESLFSDIQQNNTKLSQQNLQLTEENEKYRLLCNDLKDQLDKLTCQHQSEKDVLILSDETKSQKIQQMSKNLEDQKAYFEELINEKSRELSDMQSDLESIEDVLERKEEELSSLKEQVKIIQIQAEEKSKSQEQRYSEILKSERKQLEELFQNKLELQEARLEKQNMDIVEELRKEYMKRNDELTSQRNDLVEALKSRSAAVSKEILSARQIDNLRLEINKKENEIESFKSEIRNKEKLVLFLSEMLEKERNEITGSNKEILLKLNDITSSINHSTSQVSVMSPENSIDSFLNSNSIPNSDDVPFQELNTTWPTNSSMKLNPALNRSYDSLLSGQTMLKEQIASLKYDINMKIQDLQRDKSNQENGRTSKNNFTVFSVNKPSNRKSPSYVSRRHDIATLEENLHELDGLYSKAKGDLSNQVNGSESFHSWKRKTEATIKRIKVKFDDYNTYSTPFSITSSIVYHPTKSEVQTIIDDVNEKYTAIHTDAE